MQVKVDILEGLQRKVTIEVSAEAVDKKVLENLKKAQKTAKMDGFRKGKVPMNVIQDRYGSSVRQDVLGELIEETYGDAIKKEQLIPAGQPEINPISGFASNEPFIYEATLEIIPEFDVAGLDVIKIEKPTSKTNQADIDKMIETLRKQAGDWKESDSVAVEGDRVTIDFEGKINDETFEGGSANDLHVILGAKQMLPEFEQALYDKKAGDKVDVTVNFPEQYQGNEIAGKTAEFSITVKSTEKPELAEINEEFVKRFGIEDGTKEGLEKAISENMERELETGIRRDINQQVMTHLVDANQAVMIPAGMVEQEKNRMAQEQKLEQNIPDEEERNKIIEEQFDTPARRRVLLGLIMGKLFEDKNIKPDGERVESHIEKIASTYEDPREVREYYQKNPQAIEQIYAQVMEEQLIDELLKSAEITEVNKSFDEVMQNAVA